MISGFRYLPTGIPDISLWSVSNALYLQSGKEWGLGDKYNVGNVPMSFHIQQARIPSGR